MWAEVAKAVPTAKFLCVRNNWDGAPAASCDSGSPMPASRSSAVELRKTSIAPGDYLRAFRDMDVVLDAVPFNGHTMTCESLWMGVPVLTLRGDRPAGRLTSSVMTAMGLTEFIAESGEQFVEKAKALANGHLPPSLLGRGWGRVGGKPSPSPSLRGRGVRKTSLSLGRSVPLCVNAY